MREEQCQRCSDWASPRREEPKGGTGGQGQGYRASLLAAQPVGRVSGCKFSAQGDSTRGK